MSKINLPIAELKPALAGISKIIGRKTTLPVLSNVRIDRTKDGWITLTSTDLDSFITVRFEEPADGPQESVLVPYDDLQRITKVCNKTDVLTVEKVKDDKAVVEYPIGHQTAGEHLESMPVEEFPQIPRIKGEPIPVPDALRTSLHQAMECASVDPTRYILQGACIDVSQPKCQQVVGTDGCHLYPSNSFTLPLLNSVVIPNHKFLGWKEFNNDGEWQLRLQEDGKKGEQVYLQLSSRRWRFITKELGGNYPNWRQVIPSEFKTEIEFADIDGLIQTIERMPDVDAKNHRVGIECAGRKVSLVSNLADKPVKVETSVVTAKGADVVVYLNRELLSKALRFGLTQLELIDGMSPVRLSDREGHQMIIMPVRTGADPIKKPVKEENGNGEAKPVNSETETPPEQQERNNMPTTNGNGHQTNGGTNGTGNGAEEKPAVEAALEKIETVKGSYREAIRGLNELTDLLKLVQREQKNTNREVQSVRTTLEKLQMVRI